MSNTFIIEKRNMESQRQKEIAARRQQIVDAHHKAHQAAGMVLAGLKMLQAAHKEIEIRSGEADTAYYNLLDGQPGTRKLEHLKSNLKKYQEVIQPWETL